RETRGRCAFETLAPTSRATPAHQGLAHEHSSSPTLARRWGGVAHRVRPEQVRLCRAPDDARQLLPQALLFFDAFVRWVALDGQETVPPQNRCLALLKGRVNPPLQDCPSHIQSARLA